MQRNREGLVSIGEAFSGLDGPVEKALREASPQARHHFTCFDQVNQLVGASEADPDLGFMARMMALCSLPRTNPGNRKEYVRRNGPYTLVMSAGGLNKLPFGNMPRLLLAWVCTEVVRTQGRVLILGSSLSDFMRKLEIHPQSQSGGRNGVRTRLRNQMKRLFDCTVKLIYENERSKATVNSLIARRTEFWWNEHKPDQFSLWESKIELGEKFYNEIIQHPVPLDMNTLKALTRCALGLDLYLWLTYRTFALRAPLRLTWRQVYRQFRAHPDNASDKRTVLDFRRKVLRELKKIKLAWPELNYSTAGPAGDSAPRLRLRRLVWPKGSLSASKAIVPDRSLTYSRAGASPMPSQPAWFHRLDEILSALRSMTFTQLDRQAVEKLFRVRQRRARQIMAGLEGLRVGNAAAVSREALIARSAAPPPSRLRGPPNSRHLRLLSR